MEQVQGVVMNIRYTINTKQNEIIHEVKEKN